jgi:hypothetical protein
MQTNNTKVAVIGAALAGAVAVALATASPALAFLSGGLHLEAAAQSPATLLARGAALDVPVSVDCNATQPVFVNVSVTQRVGSQIATGSGFAQVGCTGGQQDIIIHVTANAGKAFAKRDAVATADISGCNETTCGSESTTTTIQVNK